MLITNDKYLGIITINTADEVSGVIIGNKYTLQKGYIKILTYSAKFNIIKHWYLRRLDISTTKSRLFELICKDYYARY